MAVGIKRPGRTATAADVALVERELGFKFSSEFSEFVAQYNGAVPEGNVLDISTANSVSVVSFIPLEKLAYECRLLADRVTSRFLPFAYAEGGNYVGLGMGGRGHGVYFLDHEIAGDDALTWTASSIPEFLSALRPFNRPTLKPGQVKKVWVSSELVNKVKKPDPGE
jgi:hypothetical protein